VGGEPTKFDLHNNYIGMKILFLCDSILWKWSTQCYHIKRQYTAGLCLVKNSFMVPTAWKNIGVNHKFSWASPQSHVLSYAQLPFFLMRCKTEQPFDKSSVFRILPYKYTTDSSLTRMSQLHNLSWENKTIVLNGWQFQSLIYFQSFGAFT